MNGSLNSISDKNEHVPNNEIVNSSVEYMQDMWNLAAARNIENHQLQYHPNDNLQGLQNPDNVMSDYSVNNVANNFIDLKNQTCTRCGGNESSINIPIHADENKVRINAINENKILIGQTTSLLNSFTDAQLHDSKQRIEKKDYLNSRSDKIYVDGNHLGAKEGNSCVNGDFEKGDLSGWRIYVGNNSGGASAINLTSFVPSSSSGSLRDQHKIMTLGLDPTLTMYGVSMQKVHEGNFSLRLNSPDTSSGGGGAGGSASIASFSFDASNGISFWYALVLQTITDTDHGSYPDSLPFFSYWVSKTDDLRTSMNPGNLVFSNTIKADAASGRFGVVAGPREPILFKNWEEVCVNLDMVVPGTRLTIFFLTANCQPAGHWGYAYIDGLCKPSIPHVDFTCPSVFCNTSGIIDPSGSARYTEFMWSVQRLNSNDPKDTIAGTYHSWLGRGSAGSMSLVSLMHPDPLTPGYYYVTLHLRNCSSDWVSKSIVTLYAPPILITQNHYYCCGASPATIVLNVDQVSSLPSAGGTFMWYDKAGTYLGPGSITHTVSSTNITSHGSITVPCPPHNTFFSVWYIGSDGCKNKQNIYVVMVQAPNDVNFTLGCEGINPCLKKTLTVSVKGLICPGPLWAYSDMYQSLVSGMPATYLWSTGERTKTIYGIEPGRKYTVTITTMCGSITRSFTAPAQNFKGALPASSDLAITAGMRMRGPSRTFFQVFCRGSFAGFPAYNAHKYKLRIFDRWGGLIYDVEKSTCLGFNNGDIIWDGVGNHGKYNSHEVEMGTVFFQLQLFNCDFPDGVGKLYKGDITIIY